MFWRVGHQYQSYTLTDASAVQREKPDDATTSLPTNTSATAGEINLEKKIVVRVRRQSFPSLGNQAWKDSLAYQELL